MLTSYGTETVDFAREEDVCIGRPVSGRRRRHSWTAMAVAVVLGLAGLSCVAMLHNSLVSQQEMIARMQQQLAKKKFKKAKKYPTKFAVDYVTPLKTQDERGTCWDFATVGVLENSYRQQGIARGWLQEDEYMAISEQAYGAEVLRLCAGPPGSPQQVACLIPGNGIWKNSTEGGDATLLMYLMNGLKDNIYPHSIYPTTLSAIKRAMLKHRQAMSLTTATPYTTHYYPCIGKVAGLDRCSPTSTECTLCPPDHVMTPEGGHVMTLVGYNDLYRTKQGYTGGFILKNSWFDGIHPALGPKHARGSHSLKYWLQEITEWEEASMCPNSYDPEKWYQCGNTAEVIDARRHGDSGMNIPLPIKHSPTVGGGVESCLSEETELYARASLQPLHLRCTDPNFCVVSEDYTYFVRNTTQWGDRMLRMCLFEYNMATKNSTELCLSPMLAQKIAYVLSPVPDEVRENDPDVCGFYFYPYEVQQQYKSKFGNFYVNNFEIEWHAQSYAANKAFYPGLDYSDVEKSTRKQNQYEFVGPFPFARIVDKKDLPGTTENV
ncbi:uncharacterized protein PITG_11462 [Phytophthora infestans T30-4]|uniref:Peptidase C1A papain C-terminal domain-containing protein n=1 Tax=Phytophthora infestans (strain T30-4) TaxID=403677 RepID=D0NIU3_PHYIT|nr:uncharacterized protein PITG_11462 [Phytophthora infestans T30-4]EEY59427.1 conserved hypothetical protein [Phytophthora infestans T30-4]|eukprot:XP_002901037.1 conserved hypothetical protein [Phytophthora infestans T30-4]